jgi:hypothetical protein
MTTSTTEAELLSLSNGGREVCWWMRFFKAISLSLDQWVEIFCVGLLIKIDPELKTTACYAKKYIKVATSEIRRDKKAFGLTRVGISLSTNSQL